MRVVKACQPNIEEIDAAFQVRGKPILFAFGEIIYNPMGVDIAPELMAHEAVHGRRQIAGEGILAAFGQYDFLRQALKTNPTEALKRRAIEDWWHRYINEPAFRLEEEIFAHIAEYAELCRLHGQRWTSRRAMRRTYAAHVARRLAAPLYGNLISQARAKEILLDASACTEEARLYRGGPPCPPVRVGAG